MDFHRFRRRKYRWWLPGITVERWQVTIRQWWPCQGNNDPTMHFVFPDIVTILLRKPDFPFISDYDQGFLAQTTSRHRLYRIWVLNTRPSIWRRWSGEPWTCWIIQMALWLYYGFINIPKGAFIAAGIGYKWKDDRNWYQMDFFFKSIHLKSIEFWIL